jgi:hypothetical protein
MIIHSKFPNGNIYLSGGMQHAENEGAGWRQEVSVWLKNYGYNPIDIAELDQAYTKAHGHLYRYLTTEEQLLERKSNIRKHFIDADIKLIRLDTDAVIIYYDESVRLGAGTTSEVHEAFMLDIPVFCMNSYGALKEVPGWMTAETTKIFNTWEHMQYYFEALAAEHPGILKRDVYGNRRSGNHYLCSLCGTVEEKHKSHYVSHVRPTYCKTCVEVVKHTHESHFDRYDFFRQYVQDQE